MARNGRYAPAPSIEKSQTVFAANGAPSSTPTFVRSSKQPEDKRSAPSTPSASPCEANRCIAPLDRPNGNVSNYQKIASPHSPQAPLQPRRSYGPRGQLHH